MQLEKKTDVLNHVSKEINEILQENKEVFEGKGKLRNFQLNLHVNEEVKPIGQPTRRVPYHLQNKVIAKIRELEALDIIEETTTWVSPLVVTPKEDWDIRVIVYIR